MKPSSKTRCFLAALLILSATANAQTNVFPSSGNTGIGTTSPQTPLDVTGSMRTNAGLVFSGTSVGTVPSGNTWYIYQDGNSALNIGRNGWNPHMKIERSPNRVRFATTAGLDDLVVTTAGVGIGTTAPSAKLEVEKPWGSGGPNDVAAFFGGRTANGGRYNTYVVAHTLGVGYGDASHTAGMWINWRGYQAGNSYYRNFFVGNGRETAVLMVDGAAGNVGIGTTTPGNKLEVNGTVRAKEVVVESTGWPDFVFEETYPLQGLDAVEAHIRANKHLPGVPSASEIAETGVGIGEMQRTLLQKVEELTLYIIEQDKRIRELEQRLEAEMH